MLKLFISHAWSDKVKPQFGNIYSELKSYDLWIDKTGIPPGKHINTYVAEGIRQSDVVIVLWSAAASASDAVQYELETAAAEGKEIIPCRLDNTPFPHSSGLEGRLYVDLQETPLGAVGWRKLRYLLTELYIALVESESANITDSAERAERAAIIAGVKADQAMVRQEIASAEDAAYRRDVDAPRRDQKNPYMLNMVRLLEEHMTRDGSASDLQVRDFMRYIEEVFTRLPNDDAETRKDRNTLLRAKIGELDPYGSNQQLGSIKAMLNE